MKVSPECFIQLHQRVKNIAQGKEKGILFKSKWKGQGQNLIVESKVKRTGKGILVKFRQKGPSANMTEALTQNIAQVTQVTNNNKKDEVSKQMMKNIKIFDGTNKAESITWLSQIEAAARFTNTSFCELICQSMVPSMLHMSGYHADTLITIKAEAIHEADSRIH